MVVNQSRRRFYAAREFRRLSVTDDKPNQILTTELDFNSGSYLTICGFESFWRQIVKTAAKRNWDGNDEILGNHGQGFLERALCLTRRGC